MKCEKLFFPGLSLLWVLVLAAACQEQPVPGIPPVPSGGDANKVSFRASIERRSSETKTLQAGTSVRWSSGDQVVCYYKEDLTKEDSDASAWKLLPGPIATAISAWPLTPAAFIKTESSCSQNDWFVFELMNNNYIYPKTTWTITDPDGQTTTYQQSDKEFQLTKTGKYKIQASTAQTAGTVIENLVTIINVGSGNSQ